MTEQYPRPEDAILTEAKTLAHAIPGAIVFQYGDGLVDVDVCTNGRIRASFIRQSNGQWNACVWNMTPAMGRALGQLAARW